jgi:enamine deaminase RidA (YjgF/YER057c/UK114 family)
MGRNIDMAARQVYSAGSHFEKTFGYARAVRVGPVISVAGCTATTPDGPVGGADVAAQARECIVRIQAALERAGATLADVVRTRLFVTDITTWQDVGRVHAEFFAEIGPASTIVEVAALVTPELLVEVEADAYVPEPATTG